jgi:hypothetical protein
VLFPLVLSLGALYASLRRNATAKALLFTAAVMLLCYCLLFVWAWGLLYAPAALVLLLGAALHAWLARDGGAQRPV